MMMTMMGDYLRGKEVNLLKKSHMNDRFLLVDSRDRDITTYPSANRFEVFLSNKTNGLVGIELVQAIIPVAPGFNDRYVVLAEDHCEDVMMFADRVPFGQVTTIPTTQYPTGCSFPKGSICVIPMVVNSFGGTAVTWTNNNENNSIVSKFRGGTRNVDRLTVSLWGWGSNSTPTRYPLQQEAPPPAIPDNVNNVLLVFKLHFGD